METRRIVLVLLAGLAAGNAGCGILWSCKNAEVTAVSLNACDATGQGHCHGPQEVGIPFYLPKPLLIISKNFRNVEEAKVGLTDSAPIPNYLDDQAKYADVNARTSWTPVHMTASGQAAPDASGEQKFPGVTGGTLATSSGPRVFAGGAPIAPGVVPSDGLTPDTFFTYQIVFVPDLTQKYGLRIKGGAGELRAALNMVNGWMFTGLGPFYMKDSSTAQNVLSSGIATNLTLGGAADVINSVQNLRAAGAKGGGTGGNQPLTVNQIQEVHQMIVDRGFTKESIITMPRYAEIHVMEPYLTPDGQMEWRPVTDLMFNRDFLGTVQPKLTRTPMKVETVTPMPCATKDEPKKETPGGGTGGAAVPPSSATGPNQVNVNCGAGTDACVGPCLQPRKGPVLRLWEACKPKKPTVGNSVSDAALTPEQLDALINSRASAPGSLLGPTSGAPSTAPPFATTPLGGINLLGGRPAKKP